MVTTEWSLKRDKTQILHICLCMSMTLQRAWLIICVFFFYYLVSENIRFWYIRLSLSKDDREADAIAIHVYKSLKTDLQFHLHLSAFTGKTGNPPLPKCKWGLCPGESRQSRLQRLGQKGLPGTPRWRTQHLTALSISEINTHTNRRGRTHWS